MISFLEKVRTPNYNLTTFNKIRNSMMIFLFGIALGVFSKWLDNMSLNDSIWWQHILGIIDLGNVLSSLGVWILIAVCISIYSNSPLRASINVFIFFLGMCVSYHIYTIIFAGFNPMNYMLIWYAITLISPFMAFICWYAKGSGISAFIINVSIITVMILCSFAIGMWYFDFTSIINTIFFIITLAVLYDTPKKSVYTLICSIVVSYLIRFFI
jgi:hypothetical protein